MRRPPTGQIALDLFSAGAGGSPAGAHRRADEECTSLQLHPGSLISPWQKGPDRLLRYPQFDPQTQPTAGHRATATRSHLSTHDLHPENTANFPTAKPTIFPAPAYNSLQLAAIAPKQGAAWVSATWPLGSSLVMVQHHRWRRIHPQLPRRMGVGQLTEDTDGIDDKKPQMDTQPPTFSQKAVHGKPSVCL